VTRGSAVRGLSVTVAEEDGGPSAHDRSSTPVRSGSGVAAAS
jgi:hypothetical protein